MSDTDVIETTGTELEVATRPIGKVSIYSSEDPQQQLAEARARAKVLVEVVREQGLAKTFGNNPKPHVQVEGWQFLGSQFGLIGDIEWTRELDNGWEARAAIVRLEDGAVLTHAEAECRRSESNWSNRDSYAIRSMAQTRAISKVFRNALSSVMVMAGFAATPAEEMDGIHGPSSGGMVSADSKPASPADPHCPACLAVNGELVAVKHFQAKPPWRCTKCTRNVGALENTRVSTYSWAGWHDTWEASAEEWLNDNGYGGVREVAVEGRSNYWPWILEEIAGTVVTDAGNAKVMGKAALVYLLGDGQIKPPLELQVEGDYTDEQLRDIAVQLDPAEAQMIVGAAVEMYGQTTDA